MASSTCFSGLVEFLQSKQGVKEVVVRPGTPASDAEISSWEKSHGCVLPEDVKIFYLTHNGLQLHWTCLHQDAAVPVGRIHIASLRELQPLATTQPHPQSSSRCPSLADLELGSENGWVPSLCGHDESSVMVLDYCPTCGHTCLVFSTNSLPTTTDKGCRCSVWLLDLGLSWHQLSASFSDYIRLATVHLGLRQWPYALTSNSLSPQYQYWFNIFAPHRLEVDLEHHYSNHQPQQLQQRSEVEANATGGTVEIGLNVVDVGKILQTKPLREKSGSGKLKSARSRQSSHPSTTSRQSSSSTKTN